MPFPENLPKNARYWPKERLYALRQMAQAPLPADAGERERQLHWMREFARDAPDWMAGDDAAMQSAQTLADVRMQLFAAVQTVNEAMAVLASLPSHAAPEPAASAKDRAQAAAVTPKMAGEDGSGTLIDADGRFLAGLVRRREREVPKAEPAKAPAPPPADAQTEPAKPVAPRRRYDRAASFDKEIAFLSKRYTSELAEYVRDGVGRVRSTKAVRNKMRLFVGKFATLEEAVAALADKLGAPAPMTDAVRRQFLHVHGDALEASDGSLFVWCRHTPVQRDLLKHLSAKAAKKADAS